jgi:hypothetical protein
MPTRQALNAANSACLRYRLLDERVLAAPVAAMSSLNATANLRQRPAAPPDLTDAKAFAAFLAHSERNAGLSNARSLSKARAGLPASADQREAWPHPVDDVHRGSKCLQRGAEVLPAQVAEHVALRAIDQLRLTAL